MKYCGTLIITKDIDKSKYFYLNILKQKITMDLGSHVSFENGLSLQSNYSEILGFNLDTLTKANNFQLYFEVDNIDTFYKDLSKVNEIELLHDIKEYPWGQKSIRFYDFDKHIIEIAENMENVIKCFFKQGLSLEEISKKTMFPMVILLLYSTCICLNKS